MTGIMRYAVPLTISVALLHPGEAAQEPALADPLVGFAPQAVVFRSGANPSPLYQWQFNYAAGQPFIPDYTSEVPGDITYTYEGEGNYTARLRTFDPGTGLPIDQDVAITVYPPPRPPEVTIPGGTPQYRAVNLPTTFTATALASPGRAVVAFNWDLNGDGTIDYSSSGPGPSVAPFTYLQTGNYTVRVTALDNGGLAGFAEFEARIIIPPRPFADYARPSVSTVPTSFSATANVDAGRTAATYAWDFDGDSVVDLVQPSSLPTTTAAYTYAASGSYTATLTVTDDVGLTGSFTRQVQVLPDPHVKGIVVLATDPATFATDLSVDVILGAGRSVASCLWDFGDGSAPVTTPGLTASHTYASPALVTVTATVTDDVGQSGTGSLRLIPGEGPAPPSLGGTIGVNPPVILPVARPPVRVGHVVDVFPSVSLDPATFISEIRVDFDNDGISDFSGGGFGPILHQFQNPGTHVIKVTVIVMSVPPFPPAQLSATDTQVHTVLAGVAPLECWIAQPDTGSRVWGNHVTVRARTAPSNLTRSVLVRFRPLGSGPWTTIGTARPPPYVSFSVPWDVTGLTPGVYELEAEATDSSGGTCLSSALRQVFVTVDPTTPDQEEQADASGIPRVRIHTIDQNGPSRTEVSRSTAVEFQPHSTTAQYARFRVERPDQNPHPVEARLQGLNFIPGSFRSLTLTGSGPLSTPAKVTLYDTKTEVEQALLDLGFSRLNASTVKLAIYQFDTTLNQWVPLFAQVKQPQEDLVRASLVSMGDIGLVVEGPSRAGVSSSGGGCGLLGPEPLLLLALALLYRRRRAGR